MLRSIRIFPFWLSASRLAVLSAALVSPAAAKPEPGFVLAVPPLHLVTNEADFAPFGRSVATVVAAELDRTPPPDRTRLKLLLGLRVHLALHFGDDAAALAAAGKIRALQTDPAERAHAGLTTEAIVAARHDPVAFGKEFSTRLATLPRTPEMRAVIARARERIAATTEAALLADIRENLAPRLARGEPCNLEIADQLVRIRHRLAGILPFRPALLRTYDQWLDAAR